MFITRRRQPTLLLAALLGSSASLHTSCATSGVNGITEGTVVRFTEDRVPLTRTLDMTSFTVSVVIRNEGRMAIVLGGCGPEAQRQINGGWTTVWTPICFSSQTDRIEPGQSITLPITVAGFTKPGIEPPLDPRMTAGTYRLKFGIAYRDAGSPTSTMALEPLETPSFTVYDP